MDSYYPKKRKSRIPKITGNIYTINELLFGYLLAFMNFNCKISLNKQDIILYYINVKIYNLLDINFNRLKM